MALWVRWVVLKVAYEARSHALQHVVFHLVFNEIAFQTSELHRASKQRREVLQTLIGVVYVD